MQDHALNVSEVAWGAGDLSLVSSSYDKTVKLWDVQVPLYRTERGYQVVLQKLIPD